MVKFYVFDGTVESKIAFDRKKKINSAIASLDKMSMIKRKKVQKLIGLGLPADASEEEIYLALDEYLRIPTSALTVDPIENFNKIVSYSDDLLDVKALITLLWSRGRFETRLIGGRCNSQSPSRDRSGRTTEGECLDIRVRRIVVTPMKSFYGVSYACAVFKFQDGMRKLSRLFE